MLPEARITLRWISLRSKNRAENVPVAFESSLVLLGVLGRRNSCRAGARSAPRPFRWELVHEEAPASW